MDQYNQYNIDIIKNEKYYINEQNDFDTRMEKQNEEKLPIGSEINRNPKYCYKFEETKIKDETILFPAEMFEIYNKKTLEILGKGPLDVSLACKIIKIKILCDKNLEDWGKKQRRREHEFSSNYERNKYPLQIKAL